MLISIASIFQCITTVTILYDIHIVFIASLTAISFMKNITTLEDNFNPLDK